VPRARAAGSFPFVPEKKSKNKTHNKWRYFNATILSLENSTTNETPRSPRSSTRLDEDSSFF